VSWLYSNSDGSNTYSITFNAAHESDIRDAIEHLGLEIQEKIEYNRFIVNTVMTGIDVDCVREDDG